MLDTRVVRVKAFIGNGHGVSSAAVPYYERIIIGFDPRQASRALRAFIDPGVYAALWSATAGRQWAALLTLLRPKLTLPADRLCSRRYGRSPARRTRHADTNIKRLAGTRRNPAPRPR